MTTRATVPVFLPVSDRLLRLEPSHAVTLLALMRFAEQGNDSPSISALAAALDCSTSTVVRRLDQMAGDSLIERDVDKGRRTTYRLADLT